MAIEQRDPNTIFLGACMEDLTVIADVLVKGTPTPGMIAQRVNDSDVMKWQAHASADAVVQTAVFLEQIELNLGVDDAYEDGNKCKVGILKPGDVFWGLIPSGQDISFGEILQSNGDGKLKTHGSGYGRFVSLDNPGAVTEDTRIRVEVL